MLRNLRKAFSYQFSAISQQLTTLSRVPWFACTHANHASYVQRRLISTSIANRSQSAAISVCVALFLAVISLPGCQGNIGPRLVLYCSQDREYAEAGFVDFRKQKRSQVEYRGDHGAG